MNKTIKRLSIAASIFVGLNVNVSAGLKTGSEDKDTFVGLHGHYKIDVSKLDEAAEFLDEVTSNKDSFAVFLINSYHNNFTEAEKEDFATDHPTIKTAIDQFNIDSDSIEFKNLFTECKEMVKVLLHPFCLGSNSEKAKLEFSKYFAQTYVEAKRLKGTTTKALKESIDKANSSVEISIAIRENYINGLKISEELKDSFITKFEKDLEMKLNEFQKDEAFSSGFPGHSRNFVDQIIGINVYPKNADGLIKSKLARALILNCLLKKKFIEIEDESLLRLQKKFKEPNYKNMVKQCLNMHKHSTVLVLGCKKCEKNQTAIDSDRNWQQYKYIDNFGTKQNSLLMCEVFVDAPGCSLNHKDSKHIVVNITPKHNPDILASIGSKALWENIPNNRFEIISNEVNADYIGENVNLTESFFKNVASKLTSKGIYVCLNAEELEKKEYSQYFYEIKKECCTEEAKKIVDGFTGFPKKQILILQKK